MDKHSIPPVGSDLPPERRARGRGTHMQYFRCLLRSLVIEDNGGEVLEYAIIVGLIVLAAIAAITAVGNSVMARWTSLSNSM